MMETMNSIAAAGSVSRSSGSFPVAFPAKYPESRRSHYLSTDQHTLPQKEYMLNLLQEPSPFITNHLHLGGTNSQGESLAFTDYYLTRNGHAHIPVMGEFHFSRFPRQYWEQELRKIQAGGVTIVASYVFWIHVEEEEGIFDWSGDRDVRAFVETCQRVGLPVMLRIGPFAHGE